MLRRADWFVAPIEPAVGKALIRQWHYAKGGSKTGVYFHGLFHQHVNEPLGVAQWLPPTKAAAKSVNFEWQKVIALSRLVVSPLAPTNSCSFLLARSEKLIRNDARFVTLLTYADESQGHTGAIYLAANWTPLGRTAAGYPRWLDANGRQVASQATTTRTKQQMLELGYACQGTFFKHKFVKHLRSVPKKP